LGGRLGFLNVSRASEPGSLFSLSTGALARATLDVASFDTTRLYLVGTVGVDLVDDPLYSASLGLGLRFWPHRSGPH
jgi:hypothetical protein